MKQLDFVREANQMATNRRLGHSLIVFDPTASDVLRFCSTIVAAQSSIFYLPSSIAKGTLQTNEREREKIAYTEALTRKQNEERHCSRYT